MKIQALDIQRGDRILAYCNDKRQACTVNQVLDSGQGSVTLKVITSEHHRRNSVSRVIRFRQDALIDLAGQKSISQI